MTSGRFGGGGGGGHVPLLSTPGSGPEYYQIYRNGGMSDLLSVTGTKFTSKFT